MLREQNNQKKEIQMDIERKSKKGAGKQKKGKEQYDRKESKREQTKRKNLRQLLL